MQVTVFGTGNVGSALLFPLSYNDAIDRVCVSSRKEETATAAIMDVASANPEGASKMVYQSDGDVANSDVIVITSGVMQKGKNADEVHKANLEINRSAFQFHPLKSNCVVICIATPVDDITVQIQKESGLPKKQVFGFGGDLDTNRLRYVLKSRGIYHEDAHAVGEHGPNAVALYPSEQNYEEVTKELRAFWGKIANNVDVVRNLATGDLLGKLVHSVVHDSLNVHNVCAYHPEHDVYITWPFAIGKYGVEEPLEISLPPKCAPALMQLVHKRKEKHPI
ncbi:MAG TPA: hypothetical protein V6D22_03530 [Candidatus Obscuribacterales bacterium]